ncbi:MAG TPA: hypothetical protein PKC39_07535 [Ferruginibacter sp.]|nr:hypothetical protein [Ferruginibacter sp.]HMP20795.1 hypothetical protein [Ferruginibacter sp.]
MIKFLLYSFSFVYSLGLYAQCDHLKVPFQRIRFHDRVKEEQLQLDKADGKADDIIAAGNNEEINLLITDAITRKVNNLLCFIESNDAIVSNNEKIRQVNYVVEMLRSFRASWRLKKINPSLAPVLIDNFEKILKANIDSQSMAPYIEEVPYAVGIINAEVFNTNPGYDESRKILFLKYSMLNPDKILPGLAPYVQEPFADTLVVIACKNNPKQLYDYASGRNTPVGKLISRNTNPMVKAVAALSQTKAALLYYPFLDEILSGKTTADSLKKIIGDGEKGLDTLAYFKLLVKTETEYYARVVNKDTPVAMFGTNGLREMLYRKSMAHFINYINGLHDVPNLAVRMKSIEPLTPQELYYVIVMGENDIYTSSYKHSFNRLLQLLGPQPRTDKLLMSVNMDFFKKFIKMAANFNRLDTLLALMPQANATTLMKAFVANLDKTGNLEDAVDVADSYSSINNNTLRQNMLQNVELNEQKCAEENNTHGKTIYGLLKNIFQSADNPAVDLTERLGIPSIYSLDFNAIADDSGRVIQQVFFYGDDDGKAFFPAFINSFPAKDWKITAKKEWVEIKSITGKKVWIYANKPLDSDQNLDDTAQVHLGAYLRKNDLYPSVVIHRGHSYWLPRTIARMETTAKIIVIGSCGGYKNLSEILDICPDAHILSTKEIGKGDINRPILNYMNQVFATGKPLAWKDMWASLSKTFSADPNREVRESWENYVPPYKNLGAIFIKAYNTMMENQQ